MGTKASPGPFDCYRNALPDEPMFVLLARDLLAPMFVAEWATRLEDLIILGKKPETDRVKVDEATELALEMKRWRAANDGKWRQPQPTTPPDAATEAELAGQMLAVLEQLDAYWSEDLPDGPDGADAMRLTPLTLSIWREARKAIAAAKVRS